MGRDIKTIAIHSRALASDDPFGSVVAPLYQTSTYAQEYPGRDKGYCYTRTGNPTRDMLQQAICDLEEGTHGFVFATGIAAENSVLQAFLKPGDTVVVPGDLYGGTHRLLFNVFAQWDIRITRVDFKDVAAVAEASKGARIVWAESPTNPRVEVYDLPEITKRVKEVSDALVVVDNTFATPIIQKPLNFGADIVIHSVTKYLAGHSDLVMGAAVTKDEQLAEKITFIQNAVGTGAAPFDCWLALRGLRTFPLRFEEHCRSAEKVARWLSDQKGVTRIYYPGLPQHETHEVAKRTMPLFGAIVSLELKGGADAARDFASRLELFTLAESLGGVKSLCCHPASMTHASVSPEERAEIGLSDSLVRLSVGLESADDLIADLDQALKGE